MSCDKLCHPKLSGYNTVCYRNLNSDLTFASGTSPNLNEHPLQYQGKTLELMFFTHTKNPKNSRKYLRRICLKKIDNDKNYYFKDITEGSKKNLDIRVEICEEKRDLSNAKSKVFSSTSIVPYSTINSGNTNAPKILPKIPLLTLDDDGLNLPENLNGRFYIRIYAIGTFAKERKIRMNCLFYIDYAGEIQNESESVDPQTLGVGESEVLFGGSK